WRVGKPATGGRVFDDFRQSEIQDLHFAIGRDLHVAGFQVPMNDASLVRRRLSVDGQWLPYASDERSRLEVYVESLIEWEFKHVVAGLARGRVRLHTLDLLEGNNCKSRLTAAAVRRPHRSPAVTRTPFSRDQRGP